MISQRNVACRRHRNKITPEKLAPGRVITKTRLRAGVASLFLSNMRFYYAPSRIFCENICRLFSLMFFRVEINQHFLNSPYRFSSEWREKAQRFLKRGALFRIHGGKVMARNGNVISRITGDKLH